MYINLLSLVYVLSIAFRPKTLRDTLQKMTRTERMSKARQTRLSNLKSLAARRGGTSTEADDENEMLNEEGAALSDRTPKGRARSGRFSRSPASCIVLHCITVRVFTVTVQFRH